jgi:hypothetical protein
MIERGNKTSSTTLMRKEHPESVFGSATKYFSQESGPIFVTAVRLTAFSTGTFQEPKLMQEQSQRRNMRKGV